MSAAVQVNPVEAAREVLARGYGTYEGMLLDAFTASAIVQVADALSESSREKLEGMRLDRAVDVVWKLVSK
jgi:hypothetical protein